MLKDNTRVNRTPKEDDSRRKPPPKTAKMMTQESVNRANAFNAGKRPNREDLRQKWPVVF